MFYFIFGRLVSDRNVFIEEFDDDYRARQLYDILEDQNLDILKTDGSGGTGAEMQDVSPI